MKRLPFLLVALTVVLACSDTTTQPMHLEPSFGTEPSPFFPSATNELAAVAQHLEAIQGRVGSLCVPPDPCRPDPAIIGELGAINNELVAIDGKVKDALSRPPPDDSYPGIAELKDAAVLVHTGAQTVLNETIYAKMGFDPSPFSPLDVAFDEAIGATDAIMVSVLESPFCESAAGGNRCLPDVLPGY